jgi:hypothetical protein
LKEEAQPKLMALAENPCADDKNDQKSIFFSVDAKLLVLQNSFNTEQYSEKRDFVVQNEATPFSDVLITFIIEYNKIKETKSPKIIILRLPCGFLFFHTSYRVTKQTVNLSK